MEEMRIELEVCNSECVRLRKKAEVFARNSYRQPAEWVQLEQKLFDADRAVKKLLKSNAKF